MSVSKTLREAMESLDDVKDKLTDQQYLTIANALRDKHGVDNKPADEYKMRDLYRIISQQEEEVNMLIPSLDRRENDSKMRELYRIISQQKDVPAEFYPRTSDEHLYKIYCETEGRYVIGYSECPPDTCYNGCDHVVNTYSVQRV